MSKKLEQVLEYLIAGKQARAKELLHQVFIEKARKIHEDIMSHDDMDEESMMGDEGDDWKHDITGKHDHHMEEMSDDIDSEETMAEDEGDDIDVADDDMMGMDDAGMDDDMGGDDMGDDLGVDDAAGGEAGDMSDIEDTIGDLEDALAELKAEFDRLEKGETSSEDSEGEEDFGDEDSEGEEDFGDEDAEDAEGEEDAEGDEGEEDMDESWLEEDWDDLAESLELEKVSVTMGGEVGSGKGQGAPAEKSKSPIATSQTSRMGAKPIKTDEKKHSGYNRETAPSSKDMGISNRRKSSETGMSKVSKEGNSAAKLNKTESEFSINKNAKSPLSNAPRK